MTRRSPSRFLRAVNARFLGNDSAPVRAMSFSYAFGALHDGEGSGGGGGGGGGKDGQGGSGGSGDAGDDGELPIEQQLGAVKSKNRELLGKLAKNKPLVEFAKTLGISDVTKLSPDRIERLKAALAEEEGGDDDGEDTPAPKGGKGKGKDKSAARIEALQRGFEAEKASLTGRVEVLSKALDRSIRQSAATDAITAEKGNPKLLSGVVNERVKLIEDEENPGEFSVVVVDEKGNVRYNKQGKEMTPREFVAELKASGEYDGAFAGPSSTGGGSNGGSGGGKGKGGVQGKDLVLTAEEAKDTATYRAARARAEKEGLTLKISG